MTIQKFEDLLAWQSARDLGVLIYKQFGKSKDFGFRDQICRAGISVSNNMAEGFGKRTLAEKCHFFAIARASCFEVKSMLYIAIELNYINSAQRDFLIGKCEEVARLTNAFIKAISNLQKPRAKPKT